MKTIDPLTAPTRRGGHVATARAPRARGWNPGTTFTGWLFILPALVLFAVFIVYPVLQMTWLSLTSSNGFGGSQFVGFRNFVVLARDPRFLGAVGNTLVYTVATTILVTVVSTFLALLIHHGPRRSGVVYRTLFFVPAAISLTVTGMLWRLGLNPDVGFVGKILEAVGLGGLIHPWLGDPATAMPVVILVTVWQSCGLYLLIIYAGLANIDPAIEESARLDGAGPWRESWSITVPMLRPVIAVVVMLNVIHGLKVFDIVYVMTNGGPLNATETLSTYTYLLAFGNSAGATSAFGYGSAISLVVFVVAGAATLLQYRFRKAAQ